MLLLNSHSDAIDALVARIQGERVRKGWSRKEMALRSGIKFPTYVHFERTGQISLKRLAAVCEVLGCLDDLDKIAVRKELPSIDEIQKPARKRGKTLSRPQS